MDKNNHFDLIIIGSGPTGMFGAFYAGLHGLKTLILESDNMYGGSPQKIYPNKPINDFPSIVEITGKDFVQNLYNQLATKDNWSIKYNQNILEIDKIDEHNFKVLTNEAQFYAKNIIIAIGYGSFKFKTFSDHVIKLDNLDTIHHFIKDIDLYRNKNIVICGGGNSAIEYTNLLCPVAKEIFLIHHNQNLKAFDDQVSLLNKNNKIQKFLDYKVNEINQNEIIIQNNIDESDSKKLKYDYILAFYGTELIHSNIYEINIWNKKRKIDVNDYYESILVSGLYCCGACNSKNYNNLLINGMSQISIAIDNIKGNQKTH